MSRRLWSATAALAIAFAFVPTSPALADTPPVACTIGGIPVAEGDPLPDEIPIVMSCFDSVAEAESFIVDGAPGDYEQLYPNGRSARAAAPSAAAASTILIGKAWTGTSRSGSVLIHWGSGSGCFGSTFGFPSLSGSWDNTIRSAEGFANCWSVQYDLTNYGGSVQVCSSYCSSLGAMAARTSSIVYRPAG